MIGQTISHYHIVEKLGEGGMGVVYKAEDTKLKRPVALKFLAAHLLNDAEVKARFTREAEAAAALNHPNICTVHEIDEVEGRTFIAMAFLEGEGLDKKIETGPLKLKEALDVTIQTAKGLQAAHGKGIVHRDIKPANLMVGPDGHVTIMDFGLAQLADRSKLTRMDETMGTVTYMSPEQTYGADIDHRSDVWSLGVVIYEMVTGQQPFKGHYDKAVMYSITNEEPEPMTALRTGVPMELEWLVNKCLAKDIDSRYQHASELVVDLRNLQDKLKSGKSTIMPAVSAASVVTGAPVATGAHAGLKQGQAESPSLLGPLTRYRVIENLEEQDDLITYRAEDSQLHRSVAIRVVPESASQKLEQRQRLLRIGSLAAVAVAIVAVGVSVMQSLNAPSATDAMPLRKFSFAPPERLTRQFAAHVAVSPNGRHIAFVAGEAGALWIRDLANEQVREIQGTEDARFPFWSPDSEFIGFGSGQELRKISREGTAAITVCELPRRWFFGGAWSPDGDSIVFSSDNPLALYEVPARGGTAELLFEPEESEKGPHASSPHFLPAEAAARSVVFDQGSAIDAEIFLKNLETGERSSLGVGAFARYSSTGHIVYQTNVREGGLWALPFSIDTLEPTGEAFPIKQNVGFPSVASDGTLVSPDFRAGIARQQLIWVDREGNKLGEIGQPQASIGSPNLSPDERRVAARGSESGEQDIWIHEVDRPVKTRFTFDPGGDWFAAWTPSGKDIMFTSSRSGNADIFTKAADGSGEPKTLVGTPAHEDTPEWSLDGRYLMYNPRGPETQRDIVYRERLQDGSLGEAVVFLQTEFEDAAPKFSPDGRFVVYTSNESGRFEVYVRSFPDGTGKRQISSGGGTQPRWGRDAKEIFYVERDTLMAVRVETTPSFMVDSPQVLFDHPDLFVATRVSPYYDIAKDGQRFVLSETLEDAGPIAIHVVQNWFAEFKDREQK